MKILGRIFAIIIYIPNWFLIVLTMMVMAITWILLLMIHGAYHFIIYGKDKEMKPLGFEKFLNGWIKLTNCNFQIHSYGDGRFSSECTICEHDRTNS